MKQIVVGVDDSPGSRHALRWALKIAAASQAELRAVYAWPTVVYTLDLVGPILDPVVLDAGRSSAEAQLGKILEEERAGSYGVTVTAEPVPGPIAGALIDAAQGADLLVCGSNRHSVVGRAILGTVTSQCAHHAPCPFVAVPVDWTGGDQRVVVGVDGSEASRDALSWAAGMASLCGFSLEVVLAWRDLRTASAETPIDTERTLQAAAQAMADGMVADELGPQHAGVTVIADPRGPVEALLDRAADADLLVVGARGLGGFKGLLLGSISNRVLRSPHLPTAVIHHESSD